MSSQQERPQIRPLEVPGTSSKGPELTRRTLLKGALLGATGLSLGGHTLERRVYADEHPEEDSPPAEKLQAPEVKTAAIDLTSVRIVTDRMEGNFRTITASHEESLPGFQTTINWIATATNRSPEKLNSQEMGSRGFEIFRINIERFGSDYDKAMVRRLDLAQGVAPVPLADKSVKQSSKLFFIGNTDPILFAGFPRPFAYLQAHYPRQGRDAQGNEKGNVTENFIVARVSAYDRNPWGNDYALDYVRPIVELDVADQALQYQKEVIARSTPDYSLGGDGVDAKPIYDTLKSHVWVLTSYYKAYDRALDHYNNVIVNLPGNPFDHIYKSPIPGYKGGTMEDYKSNWDNKSPKERLGFLNAVYLMQKSTPDEIDAAIALLR